MKHTNMRTIILCVCLACVAAGRASAQVAVTAEPFEPVSVEAYDHKDKFAGPKMLVAPAALYPFEMRRSAISGEVIVLVQIDQYGAPSRLAVLSTTNEVFIRYALAALLQSSWAPVVVSGKAKPVWFYHRVVFDITRE